MALVVKDRVQETTVTVGTIAIVLAGAVSGFQSFSVIGNGNTTYYAIVGGTEWEVGIGTYTALGTILSRDTILESSNGGTAVNFSAGTKNVFVTYPAEKGLYLDASGNAIALGTPASATLTNATGLPLTTGVTGTLPVANGGTGTTSTTFVNAATNITGTLPVANGGTGASTLTSNNVLLGAGTSAVTFVAPGSNGNVLTSNGSTWTSSAAPSSGGLTLLGTVTATSGNSLSLGSLNLTSYKYLYISAVGISTNTTGGTVFISASNSQVYGDAFNFSGTSQTYLTYGIYQVDLASGCSFSGASTQVANSSTYNGTRTDINTATTTIYFRISSTQTFDAGSFIVYGVK